MPTSQKIAPSTLALLTANLAVLLTTALGGWGLGDLFRLYWLELVALGFVAIAQIATAKRPGALAKSRGYQGIFFVAHYSTVCVLYFAVLPWLLGERWAATPYFWFIVWLPFLALVAAHVVAFRTDFLRREATLVSSIEASVLPYARELPIHIPLVVIAAFLPENLPATTAALLIAAGKTVADVAMLRQRRKRFETFGAD